MNARPERRLDPDIDDLLARLPRWARGGWLLGLVASTFVVAAGTGLPLFLWRQWASEQAQAWVFALVGIPCGTLWLAFAIPLGQRVIAECQQLMREVLLDDGLLQSVLADDAYKRYPRLGTHYSMYSYWPPLSLLALDMAYTPGTSTFELWFLNQLPGVNYYDLRSLFRWRSYCTSILRRVRDLIANYPLICRPLGLPVLPQQWNSFAYWFSVPPLLLPCLLGIVLYSMKAGAVSGSIGLLLFYPLLTALGIVLLVETALGALLMNLPRQALQLALCVVLPVYFAQAELSADAEAQARRDDKDRKAVSIDDTGWS